MLRLLAVQESAVIFTFLEGDVLPLLKLDEKLEVGDLDPSLIICTNF